MVFLSLATHHLTLTCHQEELGMDLVYNKERLLSFLLKFVFLKNISTSLNLPHGMPSLTEHGALHKTGTQDGHLQIPEVTEDNDLGR